LIGINAARAASRQSLWPRRQIMFATNVGPIDRILRIIVGVFAIAMVFVGPQTPWGWLGLIPLATGFFSTCPLYTLLGITTCKK
jgi:hypothetical protein